MQQEIDFSLPPAAQPGQTLTDIDTPSLIVDLDALERNIDRMQTAADRAGVALRPHAKAHKCPAIARLQIARGALGICCQKVSEAIPFLQAGITDIHISNEVVGAQKVARLARLARHGTLSVCVDDVRQVAALGAATASAGSSLGVFIEVDVGQRRCGVSHIAAARELADEIARFSSLSLRGIQAYHGAIQHTRSADERRAEAAKAGEDACRFATALELSGSRCETITGGGSGSVEFDLESRLLTEVQPGSYVFMDRDYGKNESSGSPWFEHSLFIASTVMSVAGGDKIVVDAGLKSMATDSGLPSIWEHDELDYVAANDEHGIVIRSSMNTAASPRSLPQLGAQLLLVPGHCDPTLNLYDAIIGVRGGQVESVWPVSARGLSR